MLILPIASIGISAFEQSKKTTSEFCTTTDSYDLLIITPYQFRNALQPLKNHKEKHDIKTVIIGLEEIYNNNYFPIEGRDNAEQIKYFIKNAIEEWNIDYVLLVGGKKGQFFDWYIPVRYVQLDDGYFRYDYYLSDLYYADIYRENGTVFEDWDSNGNNIFAEFLLTSKDSLDLEPDVAVGRLPCRNNLEVKIMVDKIISYETTAYQPDDFNKIILVGGDTNPRSSAAFPYEGEVACDIAASYMKDFDTKKLYTSDGSLSGPNVVINAINKGCGFLFFSGHGSPTKWGTYPPRGNTIIHGIRNQDLHQLKNKKIFPVCVISACDTGKFDVCLGNYLKTDEVSSTDCAWECLAWRLTRKHHGGAIASIASTSTPWGHTGDSNNNNIFDGFEQGLAHWLTIEFFRLYGEENMRILGDIYTTALSNYVDQFPVMQNKLDCKTVQEFVLFGDPSLKIGGYE